MLRLDRNHSRVIYRARHPFKRELKRSIYSSERGCDWTEIKGEREDEQRPKRMTMIKESTVLYDYVGGKENERMNE